MKPLLVCLAAVACAWPAAAQAAPEPNPAVAVRYGDLDLADAGQAAVMLGRIRRAAVAACSVSPMNLGTDIGAIERFEACRRAAVRDAVDRLAAPQVTARFEARPAPGLLARAR